MSWEFHRIMYQKGYNNGFHDGFYTGHKVGYSAGYESGYIRGYLDRDAGLPPILEYSGKIHNSRDKFTELRCGCLILCTCGVTKSKYDHIINPKLHR